MKVLKLTSLWNGEKCVNVINPEHLIRVLSNGESVHFLFVDSKANLEIECSTEEQAHKMVDDIYEQIVRLYGKSA